jgi:NAD(P)-dependent dehydrogenase (short-subunit alcohol dehydrogenase family)
MSEPVSSILPPNWTAPSDLLAQKTLLVTGAGAGIGATAARYFAAHGATVILLGRTAAKLEAVYDDIVAAGHPEPFIYPMDLMSQDIDTYQALADAIENDIGQLDGMLLNAAVLGQRTSLSSIHPSAWLDCMQINVNANFFLVKTLQNIISRSSHGRILFTSSSVGRTGRAYWGTYAVSKFGVEGMMQVLADELENISTIRVNSVNPGATRTDMRATAYPAEMPQDVKPADSLMPTYLYLMSHLSQDIHGQAIDCPVA